MDDVPHLSDNEKQKILASTPPWQRQARKAGVPGHGIGAIYPIPESAMIIEPFNIPAHWPRSAGMDPGWNCTAVCWFAWDVDKGGAVMYDEYYRGQEHPAVHTAGINRRGKWIPILIDPAAQKARGHDGELLIDVYRALGLNAILADNTVVSGLTECWNLLSTQQLRVFNTCTNWRKEIKLYRRDEKGEIIKKNDHLMDAMRYNVMSGRQHAIVPPAGEGGIPWFTWTPEMATPGGVWTG
jgi:Terminase RNaseH-like domain